MAGITKHLQAVRRVRIPYFRIWYSSTYTVLFAATVVFLAATPADLIYQSIRNDQIPNIFAVGGTTLVTALLALLVYSTRLYTNRSVLAAIPKPFIPIGHGEIGHNVRKLIVRELQRSALVAWDSRPRDTRNELQNDGDELVRWTTERIHQTARRHSHIHDAIIIPISTLNPPWGRIGHAGWSSPASNDLPDLQFSSVIRELPNLIEAKAVSLAPPDPTFAPTAAQQSAGIAPIPDERVVELLRRPLGLGLREYLARLANFNLINPPSLGGSFLKQYEYARFSTEALSEAQFRQLMATFAEVLASMTELDPVILVDILQAQGAFDSDSSSFAPSTSTSGSGSSDTGSVRRYQTPGPSSSGVRSPSMVTARTAPSRIRRASERTKTMVSAQSHVSDDSFTRTRLEQDEENDGDEESLRSTQSVMRHHSTASD
ncbi:hypothetical protein NA57DRAFT_50933 [Rhizodiscina lignyota]|uniref:Defect at low temperature protein 1 n=1 Tax=Rhizodiscina lignyota TaxID=1504668 RepID=A0A9P4ITN7_9PEZI|nr:hypothetical protein NA57DRAFT_50933 [Rhizodiscina lignyota]